MKNLQIIIRESLGQIVKKINYFVLVKYYQMNIHKSAKISFSAKLDKANPKGINIGEETYITNGAIVLTHDMCRLYRTNTFIGKRCFIGVNSIILPGVNIGNNTIIGSGSVVTKDVPSNVIAVGNPAKIIKRNIETIEYGILVNNEIK